MTVKAKICGLTEEEGLVAALEHGADFVGFVFFPPSPRNIALDEAADLCSLVPEEVTRVGLLVDPDDRLLDEVLTAVRLDMVQLHGHESPDRVEAIRLDYGLPVMKALPIAGPDDITAARVYADVADWLLFDAKPPKGAGRPGGNAVRFDWTLLAGTRWPVPWMLAGGLDAATVAEAVRTSGARAVDVSSGVESQPGLKDPHKIAAFLEAVKRL